MVRKSLKLSRLTEKPSAATASATVDTEDDGDSDETVEEDFDDEEAEDTGDEDEEETEDTGDEDEEETEDTGDEATDAGAESDDQAVVKKGKTIASSQPLPDLFAEPSSSPLPSLSAPWPLRRSTRLNKTQQDDYRMSWVPAEE